MRDQPEAGRRQALPIDPRMRERRVEVQRALGRRRLRLLLAVATAAAVVLGAVGLVHTSLFGARRLELTGVEGRSATQVLAASGVRRDEPLVDVAPATVAARVDRLAWVASVSVRRSWPWTLDITVRRRVPVGQIADGRRGVAIVDTTGRVVAVAGAARRGLPTLEGIGSAPAVGHWLAGASGPRSTGTARPRTRTALALALAAALQADHVPVSSIEVGRDGALRATVGAGATVTLRSTRQLSAKAAALRALQSAGALTAGATVDLSVPDRPAVTPGQP